MKPTSQKLKSPYRVKVTKEREVYTYSELWHASECVLDTGLTAEHRSTWQYLSSIVLTAFSFEAYLNHVGEVVVPLWGHLERLGPWAKMELVANRLGANLGGAGARPLQTIQKMIEFRNALAHGRSERLRTELEDRTVDDYQQALSGHPLTRWEEQLQDDSFAIRCREDVHAVLAAIHNKRPEPKEGLFAFGLGSRRAVLDLGET